MGSARRGGQHHYATVDHHVQINAFNMLPPLRLELPAREALPMPLREGQTLTATVQQSRSDGNLSLEVNGRLLEVRSNLRLLQGMTLLLRVEKESGQLLLRLDPQQSQQLSQDQAWRQLLPRQDSLRPLFQQLQQSGFKPLEVAAEAQSARGTSQTGQQPPLNQAINQLLSLLPKLQQLTQAQGLQQAIAHSGLFLESQLLRGGEPGRQDGDVKNILLRLAQLIRQQLGDNSQQQNRQGTGQRQAALQLEQLQTLLRQSESSIARIQLNQLNTLASQQRSDERTLHLELPIFTQADKEAEVIRLQIRRQRRGSGAEEPIWSVRLQLEPADYGRIDAIVSLIAGKVSCSFWCSEEQTAALFRDHLEQLSERMEEQGLQPGRYQALHGSAPETPDATSPTGYGLIDIQA